MYNFNYVYFASLDYNKIRENKTGYYTICLNDLENSPDIIKVSYPVDYKNVFIRILFVIHTSRKINSRIKLPFQKLWYPFYFKDKFKTKKRICFIVEDSYLPLEYIDYCRKKYPGCIFVKIHRDLMKMTPIMNPTYTEENIKKYFDYRFSYDSEEAKRFGCFSFDEFESKIFVPCSHLEYDVFFAGKAKNRMNKLVGVYDRLTALGLKCYFFITGCPEEQKQLRDNIEYSQKPVSYYRMLELSMKARCLLDINQENAVGYTSRFLEGIMYNKKIITDNPLSKKSKYFDERYVLYFSNLDEINVDFFYNNMEVEYNYDGDFSPLHLIERIEETILKEEERKNE